MIIFTNEIKDKLVAWLQEEIDKIEGIDKLYGQVTRDGLTNYNRDKDGFFLQIQIVMQLKAQGCDIIKVEDSGYLNGSKYDIDIEIAGNIYIQVHFGGNVFAYEFERAMIPNPAGLQVYHPATDWGKDLAVSQAKLDQLNKFYHDGRMFEPAPSIPHMQYPLWSRTAYQPTTMPSLNLAHSYDSTKILIVAPRTHIPLHFLPGWNQLLHDRVIIELRGSFDNSSKLCGFATLHRAHKQHDAVSKGIIRALGLEYIESFNALDEQGLSGKFGGLPSNRWRSSRLNTASQSILLHPKAMVSTMNVDDVAGWYMDSTGYEPSPEDVRSIINDHFRDEVSRVMWADAEQYQSADVQYNPNHIESFDRLIASKELALSSQQGGLYNAYGGQLNRDKTDAFDATVVNVHHNQLEFDNVAELLYGIEDKSGRMPDCFFCNPMLSWQMCEIGLQANCLGEMRVPHGKTSIVTSSFMRIPIWNDLSQLVYCKQGCIYAISWKDECGMQTGLRTLGSSYHEIEMRLRNASDDYIAYVVGETVVDPRACGKIVNIGE